MNLQTSSDLSRTLTMPSLVPLFRGLPIYKYPVASHVNIVLFCSLATVGQYDAGVLQ